MIPLNQFLEVIKKHGATGVLAVWLFYTHMEVQDVKLRLYACLDKQTEINRKPLQETPVEPIKKDTVAILEDKRKNII